MAATKNAFALLRLQDGEEPEKALEANVSKYKQDLENAKTRALKPKYEKPAETKDQKPRQDKPKDSRPPRDGQPKGERRAPREGGRRDGEGPARRDDGGKHRERPEGKGNRPPRRENDRKSASGRRPQDEKRREESKMNLGKQTEAEAEAAADVDREKEADADTPAGDETPAEPEEKTLTLAEFKALNKTAKAKVQRKAGQGEDQSKFQNGSKVEQIDDMTIVDASVVAQQAKSRKGTKKAKEGPKKVDLNVKFYQHDKNDERERPQRRTPGGEGRNSSARDSGDRRSQQPRQDRATRQGSQRTQGGSSAPDFNSDAAFPALG